MSIDTSGTPQDITGDTEKVGDLRVDSKSYKKKEVPELQLRNRIPLEIWDSGKVGKQDVILYYFHLIPLQVSLPKQLVSVSEGREDAMVLFLQLLWRCEISTINY